MGIECSSVVAEPRAEVFAWHTRPGAFTRLAPPWQPVTVASEADSLADGVAVLRLPGGLRWVAQHLAADYDPPHRFADRITVRDIASAPTGLLPWRHIHEFDELGPDRTRVSDRVETPVPAAVLRPMFDYRHRQLADDLAAHRAAAEHGYGPATIAITGASGLVGTALAAFLTTGGHTVIRLVRGPAGPGQRRWDPADPAPDLLDGVDAVIHLAGASIAGRFTEAHKRAVADSRIGPTERLAARAAEARVRVFVGASAVGYYGADRGDEPLDETSSPGSGFVADVVQRWERATRAAGDVRTVTVRTGIVQSPRGGTLRLLRPLFTAGLGGRIGDGRGWLPWIGIDDLVDVYHRALWDESLSGPVDAVAPHPVRNSEYTAVLARVLHRPAVLPVPSFGPELLLGKEGAAELATASQRVLPVRLQAAGHRFRTPELEPALRHLFGRTRHEND
ncbi:TIGR01777 family oxidoreductase [Nocardia sp. BMG111209]|uniref:TIGR01777 family oxidoreductase n=1 Tax=Nocardia sp. BMG111209 TaxID=1160137 RepID=UPI00037A0792|nr:TIGR01777 family oxidoreductase [Nocardia sp. BMG111209]